MATASTSHIFGELMLCDVPLERSDQRVGELRRRLNRRAALETATIAAIDGDRLVGLVAPERLLLATQSQRLGFDPAFGSGPLATVVQDLLSITLYFAIAVPLAS